MNGREKGTKELNQITSREMSGEEIKENKINVKKKEKGKVMDP
jgi:hypothetical protein